jgi:hypothetical protein
MKKTILLLTAVASMGMVSCGGAKADEAAKEMCDCMKDLPKFLKMSKNPEDFDGDASEVMKAAADMKKCGEEIKNKYKDDVTKSDMKDALESECPDVYKALVETGFK